MVHDLHSQAHHNTRLNTNSRFFSGTNIQKDDLKLVLANCSDTVIPNLIIHALTFLSCDSDGHGTPVVDSGMYARVSPCEVCGQVVAL